jgi:hypothetical protein
MPPTEFACAVSPLYGETFGAGVTGPTRRLCSKHARVVGRQLSGPKRTELYLSLVQQLCLWRCTLPMAVCVDDNMLMGSDSAQVDAEMESFQEWALDIVGLVFKGAKDRLAAREQLALGFVWDSVTLTRALESRKLESYLALLSEYAGLPTLDLRQMQSMAGKLHRMLMTLPPGLKLPWHRRLTTRRLRADSMLVHDLLSANLRRGHYFVCSLPDRARGVDRCL